MSDFNPKVSIVMPVYNGEDYMREAIDSALNQTYPNTELIVVNDGSTDRTDEIARSYGNRIRYFKKENGGQSTALNLGIEKMTGDYFAWLSHDDLYLPEKTAVHINTLKEIGNPETVLFSGYYVIDENGKRIRAVRLDGLNETHPTYYLLTQAAINGNTILIPKHTLKSVGNFDPNRPHTSDVGLFFRLSRIIPFFCITDPLICSRSHANQATYRRYGYHIYEINLHMMDCLNSLSNEQLVEISGANDIQNVLQDVAEVFATAGLRLATDLTISRLKHTCDISNIDLLKIYGSVKYRYFKKQLKRYVKKTLRE